VKFKGCPEPWRDITPMSEQFSGFHLRERLSSLKASTSAWTVHAILMCRIFTTRGDRAKV
jgi:hypothetical protein